MAFERKWPAIGPRLLTADGGEQGQITVADTLGYKVKQKVAIGSASPLTPLSVEVKAVLSKTQLIVGARGKGINDRSVDLSAFTVLAGAFIYAESQDKVGPASMDDRAFATYEQEPTNAWRTVLIDPYGDYYGEGNPLPIAFDGTVSVGDVEIKYGDYVLKVNPDGSINVNIVPSTGGGGNIVRNVFGTASAVVGGATTMIVSYTVPVGKVALLQRAEASGENIGKYTLSINGSPIDVKRTYFSGSYNVQFEFTTGQENGLSMQAGDQIEIEILHNRPFLGDFDGRIQVYEVTL